MPKAGQVAEFRDQTSRFLDGKLSPDEFRDLRLRNGLYIQRHAPMLRVSIPYGELSSRQLRMLAHIARKYDKGYGHFTTRQNIQMHHVPLPDAAKLMHAAARKSRFQPQSVHLTLRGRCPDCSGAKDYRIKQ